MQDTLRHEHISKYFCIFVVHLCIDIAYTIIIAFIKLYFILGGLRMYYSNKC